MRVGRPEPGTGEPYSSPHDPSIEEGVMLTDIKKPPNSGCPPDFRASKPDHRNPDDESSVVLRGGRCQALRLPVGKGNALALHAVLRMLYSERK